MGGFGLDLKSCGIFGFSNQPSNIPTNLYKSDLAQDMSLSDRHLLNTVAQPAMSSSKTGDCF